MESAVCLCGMCMSVWYVYVCVVCVCLCGICMYVWYVMGTAGMMRTVSRICIHGSLKKFHVGGAKVTLIVLYINVLSWHLMLLKMSHIWQGIVLNS